jgi:hypothetical protein
MWSELLVEGHVEVEKHRLACRCTTIDALITKAASGNRDFPAEASSLNPVWART